MHRGHLGRKGGREGKPTPPSAGRMGGQLGRVRVEGEVCSYVTIFPHEPLIGEEGGEVGKYRVLKSLHPYPGGQGC